MPNELANDFSQNVDNKLTEIANVERNKLIVKNDYQRTADEYSVTNPDAIADGDSMGRGTGVYLDVFNQGAGTKEDILERKSEIATNKYNFQNGYPNFQI